MDRHGLRPRDDRVWGHGGVRFGYITIIVIARRERSEGGGNPPCLRVTRTGLSLRLLVHTGSPRAFCPRDDKIELVEDTVRLLVHSGSPQAFSPRDDKVCETLL